MGGNGTNGTAGGPPNPAPGATQGNQTMNGTKNGTQEHGPKSYYGSNVTIAFNGNLGCGACIKANYIYCIPGALGSNSSSWGVNQAVCC